MKKKLTIGVSLLLGVIMMLSGCAKPKETTEKEASPKEVVQQEAKTLVLGSRNYFFNDNWDPASGWNAMAIQSYGVAETLFRLDEHYEAKSWLVKKYEHPDEYTWIFELRDDVLFHNEKKMTADSVKKCFNRTLIESPRAVNMINFKEIKADEQVLTIITENKIPTLINDLADPLWVVYDAESQEDFKEKTYYTGPFVPQKFEANVELTVKKFESYWGKQSNVDQAILRTYGDDDALLMALQSKEIDIMLPVSAANYKVLDSDEKFRIAGSTSTRGQFLQLNMQQPVFKDKAVRKALSLCIDRENYVILNPIKYTMYMV